MWSHMQMISLALHLMYALFVYLCYIPPLFLVSPSPGGICERYQTFSGGVRRTLNTGIVTLLNYGRRVPTGVSALTFAHEAGHNFGSQVLVIIHHLVQYWASPGKDSNIVSNCYNKGGAHV